MKFKSYTQSKWPLDKNKNSKFCPSSVKQTLFQNLKKKGNNFLITGALKEQQTSHFAKPIQQHVDLLSRRTNCVY